MLAPALALLLACATPPPAPTAAGPDPCAIAATPTPGPLAARAAETRDPDLLAEIRIREGHMTGDPGFYTLAQAAAECALARDPSDLRAQRANIHVLIQFHEFAAAEGLARALAERTGAWEDWLLLGDAVMERGDVAGARAAWEAGLAVRPGLQLYDRMSFLAWSTGDAELALRYAEAAVSAGTPQDPEPLAWSLTRLGWMHALLGQPPGEIGAALQLLPDYPPARFARGRIALAAGDPRAADDFRAVGRTVEATRALAELDPTIDVNAVGTQDPRGYAIWLADRDPQQALALLDAERKSREDAQTLLAWSYAAYRAGRALDAERVARPALATGTLEPRALLQGGLVLGDPALLQRALAMGPGLLPSERRLAEERLAALPVVTR